MDHTSGFLVIYNSVPYLHNIVLLLLYYLILLVGFWVLYIQKKKVTQRKLELGIYFMFPILMFILFLFYSNPVYPLYIIGLIAPVILGFSLVIYELGKNKTGNLIIMIFFLVSFITIFYKLFNLYTQPYYNNTAGSLRNQEAVVNWIYHDAKGKPFSYFVYSPDTYTYNIDYLMWWKGETKYHYQPLHIKTQSTYLIMYEPLAKDVSAHSFWKKNTIHTSSNVLSKKIFTGNITVEKLAVIGDEPPVDPNYFQGLIFR
jgi:hypothetical protein